MQTALVRWHAPKAAEEIAKNILNAVFQGADSVSTPPAQRVGSETSHQSTGQSKQEHVCAA
jgi:hypothetical protein